MVSARLIPFCDKWMNPHTVNIRKVLPFKTTILCWQQTALMLSQCSVRSTVCQCVRVNVNVYVYQPLIATVFNYSPRPVPRRVAVPQEIDPRQ